LKHICGIKQVIKQIEADRAQTVYVAVDCDAEISEKIVALAQNKNIRVEQKHTMLELGRLMGIAVAASAACDISDF